jgi:hypothetical protein
MVFAKLTWLIESGRPKKKEDVTLLMKGKYHCHCMVDWPNKWICAMFSTSRFTNCTNKEKMTLLLVNILPSFYRVPHTHFLYHIMFLCWQLPEELGILLLKINTDICHSILWWNNPFCTFHHGRSCQFVSLKMAAF